VMGCERMGFVCFVMGLLVGGRMGQLATMIVVFAVCVSLVVLYFMLLCCILFKDLYQYFGYIDTLKYHDIS
jgi:hypothetical protein